MTKVKICGITNLEDARLALELGADELGFNFYAGSARYIAPEAAKKIIEALPRSTLAVGVFVNMSVRGVLETSKLVGHTAIQLHGDEDADFVRSIRQEARVKIIKVLRMGANFGFIHDQLQDAHAILLDSYSPGERGGTGRTFDWTAVKEISEVFSTVYVAGGLTPNNVTEAITTLRPYAVDVASGVESSPGKKDAEKMSRFIEAVRSAE